MQIQLQNVQNGKRITFIGEKNLIQQIQYLKANKQYRKILQICKRMPRTTQNLMLQANMYLQLKQWNKLIDCCNQGIKIDQNQSQFYNLKGKALGKIGKIQLKIQETKKAIKLNDQIPAYHRNLGAAYYMTEKYPQAISHHTKALELEADYYINYHNRGSSLFRNQQYDLAYKDFKVAVQKNPNLGATYGWIADCAYRLGDKYEAVRNYSIGYDMTQNPIFRQNKLKIQQEIKANNKKNLQAKKKKKLFGIF